MPAMTDLIYRWRFPWTGFTGGPGLSTFYTSQDSSVVSSAGGYFKTFFESVKPNLVNGTTISYPSSLDSIDPVTGFVGETIGVTPPAASTSTAASGPFAQGVGLEIRWHTDAYSVAIKPPHGHHRTVGATFIVPLNSGSLQSDGTVVDVVVSSLVTAANTLIASFAGNLRVWSRPLVDKEGTTLRPGFNAPVISASIRDRVAFLKSRRA